MTTILNNFYFSAGVILPVFLIIAVGYYLKRKKIINDSFVDISSKVVFNVALPVLVFMEISEMNIRVDFDWNEIVLVYAVTLLFFAASWGLAKVFIKDPKKIGPFVQGSFRSNMAVVGFALILNMYGKTGLAHAAVILAFLMPLYNVLSIIVLAVSVHSITKNNTKKIFFEILKNPLIIAALVAIPCSFYKIEIHPILNSTGEYLADLSIPLALIGIGGGLNLQKLKKGSTIAVYSTIIKNIILPVTATVAAIFMGYRDMVLAIIFILIASPTAIVSYIMSQAMGADSELAGRIILISTIGSVLTLSLGIFILRTMSLI